MSTAPRLKTSLKTLAKKSLYRAGYYRVRRRFAPPRENRLVILMYHGLSLADAPPKRETIDDDSPTPTQFEAHLRALTRFCRVLPLKDAVAEIRSGGLREDTAAVTFDDGNESVYTVAYPLLAKYGTPATVFVVSSWVETGRLSWWQHLCELLEKADLSPVAGAPVDHIIGPSAPVLPSAPGRDILQRRRFALAVERLLRTAPDDARAEKLDRLQKLLFPRGDFVARDSRVLSWRHIEEMAGRGIDFESHSRTHIHIPTTDAAAVEGEILESKAEIERHTGREVAGFAYPYGKDLASYAAVEPILRKHTFAYACNAYPGTNSASSNPYSLHRYTLPLTTSSALINRELSAYFARGGSVRA